MLAEFGAPVGVLGDVGLAPLEADERRQVGVRFEVAPEEYLFVVAGSEVRDRPETVAGVLAAGVDDAVDGGSESNEFCTVVPPTPPIKGR